MARIKVILATGVPFPDAVKAALSTTIREFAAARGLGETNISGLINGSAMNRCERERQALAEALEVDRQWLDEQLDAQKAIRASAA